jgi:hypothetical protein
MVNKYFGTEATRFHDRIFRIYMNGEIIVEFYDLEKGKQYLKQLENEGNNTTSTDRGGSNPKRQDA